MQGVQGLDNVYILVMFLVLLETVLCMHDLSKYTVPKSFVGIAVPTKVVRMLVVLAIPTKVVGMQVSNQIQELKWSNFHLIDCQINFIKTLAAEFQWIRRA